MVNALRAEWLKITGNKWTTGFLIWIFPVGALGLVGFMSLFALLSPSFRGNVHPMLWTTTFATPWAFANNLFGRTFLLGFTAVTFAGEYQWGTWKNIVPRQRRSLLIAAKFINLSLLILVAFGLMSVIFGFGYGILSRIANVAYGPEPTDVVVREFLNDYALQAVLTFISVIIASIYAALAALLMKSILGGVMVGIGISVAEPLLTPAGLSLAQMFNNDIFEHLGRLSPYLNIANVNSWAQNNQGVAWLEPTVQLFNKTVSVNSLGFSVSVLAAWVVLGLGLVLYLFQRQDITT
ncbi:MAG: hypothetical protein GY803_00410 [Chloroflexi bacterium]|nr:hypothetical protein [Chloroflexota bacterium]